MPEAGEPVTVFAAASLTEALQAVATAYVAQGGEAPRFSFAASSTLARQIEAGAGADLYVSANNRWMDHLAEMGLIATESRHELLGNTLVLVAPADRALPKNEFALDDLPAFLPAGARLVIGDPAHVPAGIYAKEALTGLGVWPSLKPRLVYAADVRGALALVQRGEAALGIVYATDAALLPDVQVLATFPEEGHSPIRYSLARLEGAESKAVLDFFSYLLSQEAAEVFKRYGFSPLD